MPPVCTKTGEEIFRAKERFSLSVRRFRVSNEMQLRYGRQILPVPGMLSGTRFPRALTHAHQEFLTGLPILVVTISTGRHPIGQLQVTVSYLHAGFSLEHSAPFSEYTGKVSVLYSPITGMLLQNLFC